MAFQSEAANLIPGDTNALGDVFVLDRKTGTTSRVSVDSAGLQGNGFSFGPSISSNGRCVTFQSLATNLVAGDGNGVDDIFVRDTKIGLTTRVSVNSAGLEANGSCGSAAISSNGRLIAFHSNATNLVPNDGNAALDCFVRDRR